MKGKEGEMVYDGFFLERTFSFLEKVRISSFLTLNSNDMFTWNKNENEFLISTILLVIKVWIFRNEFFIFTWNLEPF